MIKREEKKPKVKWEKEESGNENKYNEDERTEEIYTLVEKADSSVVKNEKNVEGSE